METEDPVICDPSWLFEMLEAGFINKLILTSGTQISLFSKVIQDVAAQIGGLNYMKLTIWSTLPAWDPSYYMEADNALKCILVIYLCGRYLLITMLNLYNKTMICISPYYLSLHNFLNKMLFIVCNFLLSGNHMRNMNLQEFVREWRSN